MTTCQHGNRSVGKARIGRDGSSLALKAVTSIQILSKVVFLKE